MQELRQNASRYLSRVASRQESIEITDRGRPIARLVPITNDDWANMIAAALKTDIAIPVVGPN